MILVIAFCVGYTTGSLLGWLYTGIRSYIRNRN
jgi:hypothetical protein